MLIKPVCHQVHESEIYASSSDFHARIITCDDSRPAPRRISFQFVMVLPMGCVMEVYEVVVKAVVTHTFRVVADNQREASERANLMFSNENLGKVLELKFDVHNDQVPDANRLRSY